MDERVAVDREKIEQFCRKWRIVELSLFGSALRAELTPQSDVDVLVAFEPMHTGACSTSYKCSMN